MFRLITAFLLTSTLTGVPTTAVAQPVDGQPVDAQTARLGLLSRQERTVLQPYLERGPVGLVEFSDDTDLPAIIFAVRVRAPASEVAALIADPVGYPRFMPALDSVDIRSRRGSLTAYEWTWRTAVFTLHGNSFMNVYPPPGRRRDRPYRVEVRSTGGDMGIGRQVWRAYVEGPAQSLLVFSSRMDLRDANWVTRQIGSERSINRTINMSLALEMLLGTKREAERRAGLSTPAPSELPALRRPPVDLMPLAPILARGDLVLLDMNGDQLYQVAAIGRMGRTVEQTRAVMTDPRQFGPALIPGSYARVTAEEAGQIDFEWGIDVPLIGTSGTMRLTDEGSLVTVAGVSGALSEGRWRFDTLAFPWREAVVVGWARFDPADASWLIRMVVNGNPSFGQGITAGSEIMVLRAIRSRAFRLEEEQAAAAAR